jgi:RNA polymerase sigma factor (TIGR02999 family)
MASERAGRSRQATALVNEVHVRLLDVQRVNWENRAHFVAMSDWLMRRILVDHARVRHYQKRIAGVAKVMLDEALVVVSSAPRQDRVALNDALEALATFDDRKSRVIELRFFGGRKRRRDASMMHVRRCSEARLAAREGVAVVRNEEWRISSTMTKCRESGGAGANT